MVVNTCNPRPYQSSRLAWVKWDPVTKTNPKRTKSTILTIQHHEKAKLQSQLRLVTQELRWALSSVNREESMYSEAIWSDDGWYTPLYRLLQPKNVQHQVNHSINYEFGVNTVSMYSLALTTKPHWWGMLLIQKTVCVRAARHRQSTDLRNCKQSFEPLATRWQSLLCKGLCWDDILKDAYLPRSTPASGTVRTRVQGWRDGSAVRSTLLS